VNLRCDCNGDAAAGKTPLCRPHHIFDPGCNVKSAKTPLQHDPNGSVRRPDCGLGGFDGWLGNDPRDMAIFPEREALLRARQMSQSAYMPSRRQEDWTGGPGASDRRWRRPPPGARFVRMAGLDSLPPSCVLCHSCFFEFYNIQRPENAAAGLVKARAHAVAMIVDGLQSGLADSIDDQPLLALGSWFTLNSTLGTKPDTGKLRGRRTVWPLPTSGKPTGGVVAAAGSQGSRLHLAGQILKWGINLAGGLVPALKHLSTNMGAAFWDGIGQVFRYDLRKVVETRVKMIGQKQITPLTPWVDDWHNNVPEWLRRFIVAALASRGETYASKDISDRRREQKFRERYAILMFMLRSINPRCSEPLHNALHRLSFFSGDSWVFRKILARLNVLPSEENARMQRKYAALETLEARKLWILDMLSKGYYIMFGDDNLDWRNPGSRIHVWQQQKGNIGVHILNRQVMAMDAPPGVENLDDEFVRPVLRVLVSQAEVAGAVGGADSAAGGQDGRAANGVGLGSAGGAGADHIGARAGWRQVVLGAKAAAAEGPLRGGRSGQGDRRRQDHGGKRR
jgi:hypothetical protein